MCVQKYELNTHEIVKWWRDTGAWLIKAEQWGKCSWKSKSTTEYKLAIHAEERASDPGYLSERLKFYTLLESVCVFVFL